MRFTRTERGFGLVVHEGYPPEPGDESRLVQHSSIVLGYPDAFERPGTSALWVGNDHHLNREEVAQLRDRLTRWLETGSLALEGEE